MAYRNKKEVEMLRKKLVELRKGAKLTQENVADFCSVSLVTYQKYESGKTIPNADFLISFQKLTGEYPLPQLINFPEVAANLTIADLIKLAKHLFLRRIRFIRQTNQEYLKLRGKAYGKFVKWNNLTMGWLILFVFTFAFNESVRHLLMQNTTTQLGTASIVLYLFVVEIFLGFDEIRYWRWRKQYLKKLMS